MALGMSQLMSYQVAQFFRFQHSMLLKQLIREIDPDLVLVIQSTGVVKHSLRFGGVQEDDGGNTCQYFGGKDAHVVELRILSVRDGTQIAPVLPALSDHLGKSRPLKIWIILGELGKALDTLRLAGCGIGRDRKWLAQPLLSVLDVVGEAWKRETIRQPVGAEILKSHVSSS